MSPLIPISSVTGICSRFSLPFTILTTLNQQGNDVGPQYRSVVFYHNPEQKKIAEEVIVKMGGIWSSPIVTERFRFQGSSLPEDYHKDFYKQNPEQGYCIYVIEPKVAMFRKYFANRLKDQ